MILSPEFGERLDLRRYTKDLVARMQQDLGTQLEWAAVPHFNTDHPHFHVALRGRTDAGTLRLDRDYVKHGIRRYAENLCTRQLGFRTELDALEAERREVQAPRLTSLDRRIAKQAFAPDGDGTFNFDALAPSTSASQRARRHFLAARLRTLARMDVTEELDQNHWRVDPALLATLRAMQTGQDHQKMLTRAAPASAGGADLRARSVSRKRTTDYLQRSR